jgi:methylglutaconyl-CoA hydratase
MGRDVLFGQAPHSVDRRSGVGKGKDRAYTHVTILARENSLCVLCVGYPALVTSESATLLSVDDRGVATLTLNRPENRNALSMELVESLAAHLAIAIEDKAVRVVVLTGAGTVFCAGADLKERKTVSGGADSTEDLPTFVRVFQAIADSPKPVVAKLNGHAMAGGLGLACSCDITIAPVRAQMGFTEVRIGVAPAIISVVCLPKMRTADAAELFLTGERISATRAAEVGLVSKVVADDQLDAATDEVVGKLLLGGPNALAATKHLLRRVPQLSTDEAFRWTATLSAELFASDEARAGMDAFANKQAPPWAR